MLNVFQIAPNDQSIYFLGQIFGNVGVALAGAGPALLGKMFTIFNTGLLSVAALIVTYTTVIGVLKTANEGKFLGEKWNSLWVPLRMVIGIVALMPTKAGYCVIQVIFMWFIVQGIGAADMVWNEAVAYLSAGGAVSTPAIDYISGNAGDPTDRIPALVNNLYTALVCQAAAYKLDQANADAFAHTIKPNSTEYDFGTGSDPTKCGKLMIVADPAGDPTKAGRAAAMSQAMGTLIPVLEVLANYTANQFIKDTTCWATCTAETDNGIQMLCPKPYFKKYPSLALNADNTFTNKDSCLIALTVPSSTVVWGNQGATNPGWDKVKDYGGSNFMTDAATLLAGYAYNYSAQNQIDNKTALSDVYQGATNNGWIYAGAYYFYIANQNNQVDNNFSDFIMALKNNFTAGSDINSLDPFVGRSVMAAQAIADSAKAAVVANNQGKVRVETGSDSGGPAQALTGAGSDAAANLLEDWTRKIAPGGTSAGGTSENPLVTMQHFGHSLLLAAEVLFWVFFAVNLVIGGLSSYFIYFGNSVTGAAPGLLHALQSYLLTPIFFMVGVFAVLGAILGVYVPLLPYVLFTLGAIGWFIVCIEAMVAAPIVALAILSPGGEHEILGRAQPVPMIILNIFLRPTLMVFGLMAAMLLSYVVVYFINGAFYNVLRVTSGGGSIGLFEGFFYLTAYAGLIVVALNKCFSLIHHVPDKVMRYMGAHGEGFGEEQAAGEIKGKVSAAGGEAKQMTGSSGAGGAGKEEGAQSASASQQARGKEREAGSKSAASLQAGESKGESKGSGGSGSGGGGGGGGGGPAPPGGPPGA